MYKMQQSPLQKNLGNVYVGKKITHNKFEDKKNIHRSINKTEILKNPNLIHTNVPCVPIAFHLRTQHFFIQQQAVCNSYGRI